MNAQEFGEALLKVVGATPDAPEAKRIRERARKCAGIIEMQHGLKEGEKGPTGREVAAEKIWQMATEEFK